MVDDYGHHPTEVKATLAAARLSDYKNIRVLFQPHRFTRTKHLLEDFGTAFHQADDVYLLDIYAASEKRIEGVSGEALADKVRSYGHRSVHYVRGMAEGIEAIAAAAEPGDLIITLGAGSVSQAGDKILERLRGGGGWHGGLTRSDNPARSQGRREAATAVVCSKESSGARDCSG